MDGKTLSGQNGSIDGSQLYTPNVPAGYSVRCVTSCDNGDADLYLSFGGPESPFECVSEEEGSYEVCSATAPASEDTILYAEVYAFDAYSHLEITCTISPPPTPTLSPTLAPTAGPIALMDGKTLSGQNGSLDGSQLYTLNVPAGYLVKCVTSCSNGDADLALRFGDPGSRIECSSDENGSSEVCSATAPASEDTTLYAEVIAYKAYSNLEIKCTTDCRTGGLFNRACNEK
jgi:hypothetical protein